MYHQKRILGPDVLTFNKNRITYKGRDITFSNGFNKTFNINSTDLSDPNENAYAGITLTTYSETQKSITLDRLNCTISFYIGLGTIAQREVFSFETLEPLMIVKNSDGSVLHQVVILK